MWISCDLPVDDEACHVDSLIGGCHSLAMAPAVRWTTDATRADPWVRPRDDVGDSRPPHRDDQLSATTSSVIGKLTSACNDAVTRC